MRTKENEMFVFSMQVETNKKKNSFEWFRFGGIVELRAMSRSIKRD